MGATAWIRGNGFLLGLFAAVGLAFWFPEPGARGGRLHPELLGNCGIALILFLQGLSLPFEKIKSGAGHWRLHAIIQGFTFAVFPLVGWLLYLLFPRLWPAGPAAIRDGFLYLCVLPSTISTSVVLTSMARGNTAAALFNAALSNILGVLLTPLFVHLLMRSTGATGSFAPLLLKIFLLTLVPFSLGAVLHPCFKKRTEAWQPAFRWISNAVVLFIVYSSFCDSVRQHIWHQNGLVLTAQVLALTALLFGIISALVHFLCRFSELNRADEIAAYFCSVKKTLALGAPLALLIFGDRPDLPLILLPILFYHQIQIFVNGLLAHRWSRADAPL
jgi:sodium/bile acid cotransporter 7